MLSLEVGNVNIKLIGNIDNLTIQKLFEVMTYKTIEFNGFNFIELQHNLFNKLKQSFPTGLFSKAADILEELDVKYDIVDKRQHFKINQPLKLHDPKDPQKNAQLRDYQKEIAKLAVEAQRFVIQVATGGGKTVIAAAILAELNVPSIFVVHTGDLFEQAHEELSKMLNIPIGKIGGGECDIQKINVCMIQTIHSVLNKKYIPFDEDEKELMEHDEIVKKSFIKNDKIKKFIQSVSCILVDEVHHLSSRTYIETMKTCTSAFWRGGMSATPHSGQEKDMILQAYAGKIICRITASYLIKRHFLVKPKIYYLLGTKSGKYKFSRKRYNAIYKEFIINNTYRNELISDCVSRLKSLNKSVLITVTTKNHGQKLLKIIQGLENTSVQFICSHVNKMVRKEYLNQIRNKELDVIIATQLADEGLDLPALDSLILAGAGKSPTRMIQRIGRVLRIYPGKEDAIVIDFKDSARYLAGHYKKRREMCEKESEFEIIENL
jgi:superfamily II DNA or RNA helicase